MTRQSCGSCVGARGVLERFIEREEEAIADLGLHASRLEHRKERPHRVAKMIEQAIEYRIDAAHRTVAVARARGQLARIPITSRCPVCLGRGERVASGTFLRGIA